MNSVTCLASLPVPLVPAIPESGVVGTSPLIQLMPDGAFSARDGRPGTLADAQIAAWTLTPENAASLLERWRLRATPLVVDYEHQSLNARQNGQPAPAAGWIEALAYHQGKGLLATVKWTATAAGHIRADEYRYISPTFTFDPVSGAVLELKSAALTNTPALDGMDAVAARENADPQQEQKTMDFAKRLKVLLGLPETATDAVLSESLDKLEAELKTADGSVSLTAHLAALTEQTAQKTPDATRYAPLAALTDLQSANSALQEQIRKLSEAQTASATDRAIDAALADGRITAATEVWARELGKTNPANLTAFLAAATPIAALTATQTGSQAGKLPAYPQGEGEAALTESDLYVCQTLGMSKDDFLKAKKEQS